MVENGPCGLGQGKMGQKMVKNGQKRIKNRRFLGVRVGCTKQISKGIIFEVSQKPKKWSKMAKIDRAKLQKSKKTHFLKVRVRKMIKTMSLLGSKPRFFAFSQKDVLGKGFLPFFGVFGKKISSDSRNPILAIFDDF